MKKNLNGALAAALLILLFASCSKNNEEPTPVPPSPPPPPADTISALKDAADFTVGVAVPYNQMVNDAKYLSVLKRDFDGITLENDMKHFALVRADGSLDFSRADAIINAASGMQIYGHTLGWHQGQNAAFLKQFAGIAQASGPELLQNGGFESGDATAFSNWSVYNAENGATLAPGSGANEVKEGTRSLKVVNPVANPGSQWKVQVASDLFATTVNTRYQVSFQVKAATAGGSLRLSTGTPTGQGSAQYQADQSIGTSWTLISWTFVANSTQTRILFDLGQAANTYYIDDVSVKELVQAAPGGEVAAKLDEALQNFITGTVSHFKGKVKAWDVVNELFADGNGAMRNLTNTQETGGDAFVWSHYMGRQYAEKAFAYAAAADPTALLFINDYALESNNAKLDSLVAFVADLKKKGIKIDGIGTQMHVAINTSQAGIDNMMRKLAATGLKVRISELDVKANVQNTASFTLTPALATTQANMYRYIVKSYLTHVPKAQQYGITFWGLTDNTSWLYQGGKDFPLLYHSDLSKKPAYDAVLQALKGK